jgi:hypothetical protein
VRTEARKLAAKKAAATKAARAAEPVIKDGPDDFNPDPFANTRNSLRRYKRIRNSFR